MRKTENHLYFLRHCKTDYCNQKIITGQTDISILDTEKTVNLYQFHASNNLKVISSPLKRCQETIEIFRHIAKCNPEIVLCNELLERNMGVFERIKKKEAANEYPEFFKDGKLIYDMTPPNGESFFQMCHRADMFIDGLLSEQLNTHDILVCSHNHFMKLLYFKIMNIPLSENWYSTTFFEGKIYKLF